MLQLRNQFHIAFYSAALAISITVIVFTILQRRTDRPQNRWFLLMMSIVAVNALTCTGSAVTEPHIPESDIYYHIYIICQNLYFMIHTALCPVMYYWVLNVTGTSRRRKNYVKLILAAPFIITEVLTLFNPLLDIVFYYDENMKFHRNWAEYLIYGAAGFYFILAVVEIMFSWKAINNRRRVAMTYFFTIALAGVVIQFINIDIKSELFAEALAMMGAMLAVESEDDRLDVDINVYNRRAMQMDIHNFLTMHESVPLIYVKVINAHLIERMTHSANVDVPAVCADYFKTLLPRYQIYHPNPSTFVLFCNKFTEEQLDELTRKISSRFKEIWTQGEASYILDAIPIRASVPTDIATIEDALYIADSIIPSGENKTDVKRLMHRAAVERAIRRCIREHKFEVYYQPTYYMEEYRLHGAEALVRMHDDTVGFVSPEEFIPMAEQIGVIEQIDDYVLSEVCAFLASGVPAQHVMDCINVNLSVIQCMRPGFFEHIVGIVDSYRLDHSLINFEITESVGAENYEKLAVVAHRLKMAGFSLSMDDYGTGYSNMEGIFSLNFDIIKIDKSLLWSAEKNERGFVILKNSVRMIHDLGCQVLTEGVETEAHIALLRELGVDFLQGYYFSKPVPKDEFLKVIEKR
ncbi:MAG: EAL domain-containing protein [Ruminiclostridium sp.]|nr:EAL domain-containing protein [Ruminiclostridium sp.]